MKNCLKTVSLVVLLLISNTSAQTAELEPKFVNFFEWVSGAGANFDKLELRKITENFRGIYAKADIAKGEEMLFVPDHLVMSMDKAKQSKLGAIMTEKRLVPGGYRLNSPTMSVMAVANMENQDLGKESPFFNHWEVQPGLDDFPVFFTEDERSWLEGSPFIPFVDEEIENTRYDYELIKKDIPEFGERYTQRKYAEQKFLVTSRNFGVTIDGKDTNIQVPLADMFNTQTPKNAYWYYSNAKNGFVVEADDDIKEGEQIYDSYGTKCNYRFFLYYAFINLDKNGENEANEVPLFIDLDPTDEGYEIKKEVFMIGSEKSQVKEHRLRQNVDKGNWEEYLAWVRFVAFEGDLGDLYDVVKEKQNEAVAALKSEGKDYEKAAERIVVPPIDLATEVSAWKKTLALAKESLSKYPTTYKEDQEILAKVDSGAMELSYNKKNCLLLRIGEKRILHFIVETAEAILELSSLERPDAVKALMKQHKVFKKSMKYVQNTFIPLLPDNSPKEEGAAKQAAHTDEL